jgi:hypothetical protein
MWRACSADDVAYRAAGMQFYLAGKVHAGASLAARVRGRTVTMILLANPARSHGSPGSARHPQAGTRRAGLAGGPTPQVGIPRSQRTARHYSQCANSSKSQVRPVAVDAGVCYEGNMLEPRKAIGGIPALDHTC